MFKSYDVVNLYKYYIIFFPFIYLIGPAVSDGLLVIFSILFLILIVFKKIEITPDYTFKSVFFLFLLFLLFSIAFILNFNSKVFIEYLLYARFFIFLFLLIYFLKYFNETDYIKIFKIWIYIYVFVLLDAFIQYFIGINILGFKPEYTFDGYNHITRLTGIFKDEPIVGSFLSKFLIIPVGYLIIKYNSNKTNLFSIVLIFMSTFLVLVSTQRAAIIYLMLTYFFFFFLLIRSNNFKIIQGIRVIFLFLIPIILFILIAINSFEKIYKERIFSTFVEINKLDSNSFSTNETDIIIDNNSSFLNYYINSSYAKLHFTAIKLYFEDNYLGLGFKNYRNICNDFENKLKNFKYFLCSTHPHNYYIELFVENGIFGIIFIFTILFLIFSNFKNNFFIQNNNFQIIFLSCLLIYLWPLIPTGSFTNNYNSVMFWYLFGMSIGMKAKL